jgi:DNA integrity scanning protein DisA with diadenylate cyclase activity
MPIIKSIPIQRRINGLVVNTSEVSIVSEREYKTMGEECIIVKGLFEATIYLDSSTTEHIVIKALIQTIIKPLVGKIDEQYDEIFADKGSCIEFRFCEGNWYILSSDGLKSS